jgi:hypothetical protein
MLVVLRGWRVVPLYQSSHQPIVFVSPSSALALDFFTQGVGAEGLADGKSKRGDFAPH